mgnify:CR=1 FL=1|tara:strand:+ start:652 stop:1167 length:516 start_codon:yes stop_codon:yes gene_type:complete
MNTIILSSSLSKNSKSFILCKHVEKELRKKGINTKLIDARKISINPYHLEKTKDLNKLTEEIKKCDNIIIAMGVHNYSINDNLKIILDNCFQEAIGKFFGIICAAGGERSYLSTQHLTQICMNEWRMIQLPRIIYATKNKFIEKDIITEDIIARIKEFTEDFHQIGSKLLS